MSDTPRTDDFWHERGDGVYPNKTIDSVIAKMKEFERELTRLRAENETLRSALSNLELGANTVGACYSRNPGNFAAALRDLREYADAARAALEKETKNDL